MPVPRTRAAAVLLGGLCLLAAGRPADPEDRPDDKAKAAEAKRPDISKLPNDEVLKQAAAIYARGSDDYLAAARALAGAEARLDDAAKQLAAFAPPKKDEGAKGKEAEDAARAAVEAAKGKAESAKQKCKLALARKQLQEKVAGGVEGVQQAAGGFQGALDDLRPYAVELDLRVKDGTLPEAKLPGGMRADDLAKKRQELAAEQEKLKGRLTAARTAAAAAAKLLEDAEKAVVATAAEATEAGRAFAREQQRKELEKQYAGKTAAEMLTEVGKLVQDGAGLKGTYELAFRQFSARAAGADKLRKELADLKPPEAKIPQITRAEDVQQAAKAVEGLIAFYTARTQKMEALKREITTLAELGGEFEADAAVSDDHLFKMQVVAALIDKAGAADKLPEQAGLNRLAEAAERAKKLAAEVRAGTEKAKTDLPLLAKSLAEAGAAGLAAADQLASLKQTQDATLAALRFEEQIGKQPTPQVVEQFHTLRKEVAAKAAALKAEEVEYRQAAATAADARAKLDALKDPLLRAAEEAGQAERQKLLADLRKEAGLDRAAPPAAEPKKPDDKADKKPDAKDEKEKKPGGPPPLEHMAAQLSAFQQQLAARVRVLDEREEKARVLLGSLEDLEKKAAAYSKTLADARLAALRLNAAAVDIKKRVGRAELESAQTPEGVTAALAVEARKRLDADSAAVLNALSQTRQDLEALRKPDPQADAIKATAKELLTLVGRRIDLLSDLKKLAADYRRDRKDRPDSEQKRLDQTAVGRMERDAGRWEWIHSLDKSQAATNLAGLMETYYREVVEIEGKEETLKTQQGKVDELIDLAGKERAVLLKVAPLMEKERVRLEAAREEEAVVTRARLKPEGAEEMLKAFQAKTGRVLPKPLPLAEKDRSAKVDELAAALFERAVQVEAAKKWDEILAGRLAPAGLTAEAGVYQDELAQLNATSGANARRVAALTGNDPPEAGKVGSGERTKLPAAGGEIGKTRGELAIVRTRGVRALGIRVGLILLAAFLLPRLILFVLRRTLGRGDESGSSSMVLTALGAFIKVGVWVAALAMILSALGFDVTAIIAGLGIGGLAIGLAAQPMIADVIGALVIFAERRFKIGDVIRTGNDDPARVVGLSWRSTALKNASGLVVTVPNRKVTEASIQNLTKAGQTYDSLTATITTTRDVNTVLQAVREAMDGCENLTTDHGVSVKKFTQKGERKEVEYRFWWFLRDYEARDKTRDEVFARIGAGLAAENMAGTEVTLA